MTSTTSAPFDDSVLIKQEDAPDMNTISHDFMLFPPSNKEAGLSFRKPAAAHSSQMSQMTNLRFYTCLSTATEFFNYSSAFPSATQMPGLPALQPISDTLLDSPLGLSPLNASDSSPYTSPFDLAMDDYSPFLNSGEMTPELDSSLELPSLFGAATATSASAGPAHWSPQDVPLDLDFGAGTGSISPQMTTLSSFSPAPPTPVVAPLPLFASASEPVVVAPAAPAPAPTRPAAKRASSSSSSTSSSTAAKDKFNGTRNTKIPAIDFDAPTMSRSYIIPAVTSRKRAPTAITSKLVASATGPASKKRKAKDGSPDVVIDVGEEGVKPEELPEEVLRAVEEKRRSNTLAARRSRMRKQSHLQELNDTIERLQREKDELTLRAERAEELVRALRGC
ncbi:hypothetical protein MNV49_006815 [Pseudohyphozyma bogoriensis]|nr:hypothetical protein MNV49_006815 [Pseudohyphozyma bogoriensis]